MIEFIIFAVVIIVAAFWAGWKTRELQAIRYLQNYRKILENVAEEETVNTVMIEIQRDGDQFYIYDKTTGEFLAQGSNHAEVSTVLGDRFPNKRFTAMPQNLKDVGYQHDSI